MVSQESEQKRGARTSRVLGAQEKLLLVGKHLGTQPSQQPVISGAPPRASSKNFRFR